MDPLNKIVAAVAEIDQAELATRLIEIGCHMTRPVGTSGQAAWGQFVLLASRGEIPPYIVADFDAMAVAAIEYFGECASLARRAS